MSERVLKRRAVRHEFDSRQHPTSSAMRRASLRPHGFPGRQALENDLTAYFEKINNNPKLI